MAEPIAPRIEQRSLDAPLSPETNTASKSLEAFAIKIAKGNIPIYTKRPPELISTDIEAYVNRITALTQADPEHNEYGGSVRFDKSSLGLIYPNPIKGTPRHVDLNPHDAAYPSLPEAIDVHSHANNWSFSGYRGDVGNFVEEWGKSHKYAVAIHIVGTPEYNYLLLRTQQTPIVTERLNVAWDIYEGFQRFRKLYPQMFPELAERLKTDSNYKRLFDIAEKQSFGGSFDYFCRNLLNTLKMAQVYKAGFYYSAKDGVYKPATRDFIDGYIQKSLEEAIGKAQELTGG